MKKEKELKPKREKKPVNKARRKKIIVRSILAVAVLLLAGLWLLSWLTAANVKPTVFTQAVTTGDVAEVVSTSGNVKTEKTKVYFANIALPVAAVNVEPGDTVTAGEVLLTFDADTLSTEKQLTELKLQSIGGGYDNSIQSNNENLGELTEANTNIAVLEQQIADTEALIKDRENKISKKKSDLAYWGTLLQVELQKWTDKPQSEEYENMQSQIQYNNYEQQYNKEIEAWQDEIDAANKTLSDYQEYRSEMKSQKSSSEASTLTSGAKSELDANNESQDIEANRTMGHLTEAEQGITAEFTGVVTGVEVVQGATTVAGGQLFTLESTEDVKVEVSLSKYDLEKVKEGQSVDVTVAGKVYQGQVSKISKMAVNNSTGTPVVATDIKILNPDTGIYLGVDAKVLIHTAEVKGVVQVPAEAVNVDQEGEFIYVVENNLLQKRRVVTGISSDSFVEVKEGLAEGDSILTELVNELPEGTEVTPVATDMTVTEDGAAGGGMGGMRVRVGG